MPLGYPPSEGLNSPSQVATPLPAAMVMMNSVVEGKLKDLEDESWALLMSWDSIGACFGSAMSHERTIARQVQTALNQDPRFTPAGVRRETLVVAPYRNPVGLQSNSASLTSGTLGQADAYLHPADAVADMCEFVGEVGYTTGFPTGSPVGPFGATVTHYGTSAGNELRITFNRGLRVRLGERQRLKINRVSGTYTVTIGDGLGNNVIAAGITYNASTATVQAALRAALATLPNFRDCSCLVTGSYASGYDVQFTGREGGSDGLGLASRALPLMTFSDGATTGVVTRLVKGGVSWTKSNDLHRHMKGFHPVFLGGRAATSAVALNDIYGRPLTIPGSSTVRTSIAATVGTLTYEVRLADGTVTASGTLNPSSVVTGLSGTIMGNWVDFPDLSVAANNQDTVVAIIFPTDGKSGHFSHLLCRDGGTSGVEVIDYSSSGKKWSDIRQYNEGVDGGQWFDINFAQAGGYAAAHYSHLLPFSQGASTVEGAFLQSQVGGSIIKTTDMLDTIYSTTTGNGNGLVHRIPRIKIVSLNLIVNSLRADGACIANILQHIRRTIECCRKNGALLHLHIEPSPLADSTGSYFAGTHPLAQSYCVQRFSIKGKTGGTFRLRVPDTILGTGGASNGWTTDIAHNATAGTIDAAVAAINAPNGPINVGANVATECPDGANASTSRVTFRFTSALAQKNVGLIELDATNLTGSAAISAPEIVSVGDLDQPWDEYGEAMFKAIYAESDNANHMFVTNLDSANGYRDGGFLVNISTGPAAWTTELKFHSTADGIHRMEGHPPIAAQVIAAAIARDGVKATKVVEAMLAAG